MAEGIKLDIDWSDLGEGWVSDNRSERSSDIETLPPNEHRLVIRFEKRRGKPVTMAGEFFLPKSDIQPLLKKVKSRLGCGGTFKKGWLEVQGRKTELLKEVLRQEGFLFKR